MSAHDIAHTNRLAGESSPYLLLHRHNPVDWFPWGPEALEKARREDKPIFLSVGYSTCYWCHVMERESFSSPEIAELMNREFVNVKLDREERPDLDEIYMTATQILTGQGGWPNSLFLTPDLKPFYAGTYFPPEDRHGRPGFPSVLQGLSEAWRGRRADVEGQAEEMAGAMRRILEERAAPAPVPPDPGVAETAVEALARRLDREHGGFGGAPKFPTPANLFLLLETAGERPVAAEALEATLDAMARGGIYDQLGGGFHRYAVDREWRVPHFEKMLYDNGLLLEVYARERERTGSRQAERIVRETAEWLAREMTSPEGAFWSAIDAETHGDEGAFYVWTREEIESVLGPEDAAFLAPILGFDGPPFFERDRWVLHLPRPLAEVAERRRLSEEDLLREIEPLKAKLFEARARRERPNTDDKVLADWNGMTISGLAVAGRVLGEPSWLDRAARAADFLLKALRPEGGDLCHAWRAGQAKVPAMLGDYAFLVRGLLALHEATGEERWLDSAAQLTQEQIARLRDPVGGFFTAGASPDLLFRSKEVFDGATPAANAVAALNLLALAERTGRHEWRSEARAALQAFGAILQSHPDTVRMMVVAVCRYHDLEMETPHGAPPVEEQATHEREASAAGVNRLAREAAKLVEPRLELAPATEGGWRPFRLILEVEPGWHVQANPTSEEFLFATELKGEGVELREVRYPAGEERAAAFTERPVSVYSGRAEISGQLRGEGKIVLSYQPCDDARCLPPTTREVRVG